MVSRDLPAAPDEMQIAVGLAAYRADDAPTAVRMLSATRSDSALNAMIGILRNCDMA